MPCSGKTRRRAQPALPPVHGEVREGVCPSESPAGITKISQNTAASSRGSGKERGANKRTLSASKGRDVQISWQSFRVGSHTLPAPRDAGWAGCCSSSSGPPPLECPSYLASQHSHLTQSVMESNYTMIWVKCNISWIALGSIRLRAQHFMAAGMGTNN